MKHLFIILITASILLQTFSSSFILVNYQVNKEYISKTLCENKNKPMMHCNGKCHLQKQLSAQEKKDKSPFSQNSKEEFQLQYISEDYSSALYSINKQEKITSTPTLFIPNTYLESIFHPPPSLI